MIGMAIVIRGGARISVGWLAYSSTRFRRGANQGSAGLFRL